MGRGRKWTSEEKAKIVLQGLTGRPLAELCNEYQIRAAAVLYLAR